MRREKFEEWSPLNAVNILDTVMTILIAGIPKWLLEKFRISKILLMS